MGSASEQHYVTRVLPRAIAADVVDAVLGRRRGAWARIRTIVEAVALTTAGYVVGRLTTRAGRRRLPADARHRDRRRPSGRDPPRTRSRGEAVPARPRAARRRGHPLGVVECAVPVGGIPQARVAELLRFPGAEPDTGPGPRRDDAPFVSVVVATRDRPEALRRCLDSLERLDYPSFEIVVVDNCPSSGEAAEVVAGMHRAPSTVRYVREDSPGLACAHNRGLRDADGDIVAFTDDDVVVDRHWLDAIVDVFAGDPTVGGVTGMIMPVEIETESQAWIEGWAGFGKGLAQVRYDEATPPKNDPLFPFTAGVFGSGANMAFRRRALDDIGGFDRALGAGTPARGGDDLATFFDVITAGYVLGVRARRDRLPCAPARLRGAAPPGVRVRGRHGRLCRARGRSSIRAASGRDDARPSGRHYLAANSEKNKRRPADFPRCQSRRREPAGLVVGPWRYCAAGHLPGSGECRARVPDVRAASVVVEDRERSGRTADRRAGGARQHEGERLVRFDGGVAR